MTFHPALRTVLADPVDHGPLHLLDTGHLVNPRRAVTYPVHDGVPRLLVDRGATPGQEEPPATFDGVAGWYDALMQDPTGHGPLTELVNGLVAEELGAGTGTVLDIACGTGLLPRWLAPLGYTVVGLDYSADQLRIARDRLPVVQGDAAALPFRTGSAAAVVTIFSAAPDHVGAARETARVLAPGGRHVAVFVHPALNGSLSRRHDDGSVTIAAGYHEVARFEADHHASSVRGRVGSQHQPLDARLSAYLDAGLRLRRFVELGEGPGAPTSILTSWSKE